jgi:outer membrane protein insertion porin family
MQWEIGLLVRARAALLALLSASLLPFPPPAAAQAPRSPARPAGGTAAGGVIADIRVEGNERIESGTIRSYMLVAPGDRYDADRIDRSLKTLYATGLFSDVSFHRDGATLVVRVKENPIVNKLVFEGNHKLTDENLRTEVQLKPRAVFTPAVAQADRQRILDAYARRGRFAARVEPKVIELPQNRVDVVFEITDGDNTLISRIAFVGNKEFSESRLKEVIGSRETAWWRFLSSSDTYDPDRVGYDKELLRRFYLKNGFADFEVTASAAELAPDKSAFFVTYTLNEGARYRVSKATVNSTLRNIDSASLEPVLEMEAGDWYDGDSVERTVQALTDTVQARGQPFVDVHPRVQRDRENHTIELVFDVSEGPRVYVERIEITGNTRTMDKVIRREFRLAEGDAFNAALLRRSRQRLQDLGYFTGVTMSNQPGSAPDKAIVNTRIDEKATGELTIGGGYSTDAGALANAGLRERNLIGSGIDAGLSGTIAQRRSQVDLSVTDPYFLDRNIVAGADVFLVQTNNQLIAEYDERRIGFSLTAGYEFSEHLRQSWAYSLVQRDVYNVQAGASLYVQNEAGITLLSQIGQTLTLDYRDSRVDPRTGWVMRFGTDFAGLGGDTNYVRTKVDGRYFIPLERYFGSNDWDLSIAGGAGYLFNEGVDEKIIDRFFLGGDNLRGFQTGGAGPHAVPTAQYPGSDSLGGRFIWTQSTELRFPLPVSPDLGLSGRVFVDVGALTGVTALYVNGVKQPYVDDPSPRVGTGVGISWKTPFGLINIDLAQAVVKKQYDQTQFFRFGFGTRF